MKENIVSADEMFEELGYKKIKNKHYIIFEKGVSTRNRIIFSRLTKNGGG